jgi:hypothetical protein
MRTATLRDLLDLLRRLDAAHIRYRLANPTENAVMVEVAVPGERWEIELHADGEIGVEVFASALGVQGAEKVEDLFRRFSD